MTTLPSIQQSIYCTFEDLIWIAWLTVKTNWPVILVWAVIIMTIYLILKYQGTRSLIRIQQQRNQDRLVRQRNADRPGKHRYRLTFILRTLCIPSYVVKGITPYSKVIQLEKLLR